MHTHTHCQPCNYILDVSECPYQHPCSRPCHQECSPCIFNMGDVKLPCGHTSRNTPCHKAQNSDKITCMETVNVTIEACGHNIDVFCCASKLMVQCTVTCGEKLPCGHNCKAACGSGYVKPSGEHTKNILAAATAATDSASSWDQDDDSDSVMSRSDDSIETDTSLTYHESDCDDNDGDDSDIFTRFSGKEGRVRQSKNKPFQSGKTLVLPEPGDSETAQECPKHGRCTNPCGKIQPCGHVCSAKQCHHGAECPPCQHTRLVSCTHITCADTCTKTCAPCIQPCAWQCTHQGTCKAICGAPCTRLPCDNRCDRLLPCKHRCPSVCGEPCPSPALVCQLCEKTKQGILDQCVDPVNMTALRDQDLDRAPVIVLECGHVFTMGEFSDPSIYLASHMQTRRTHMHTQLYIHIYVHTTERTEAVTVTHTCARRIPGLVHGPALGIHTFEKRLLGAPYCILRKLSSRRYGQGLPNLPCAHHQSAPLWADHQPIHSAAHDAHICGERLA